MIVLSFCKSIIRHKKYDAHTTTRRVNTSVKTYGPSFGSMIAAAEEVMTTRLTAGLRCKRVKKSTSSYFDSDLNPNFSTELRMLTVPPTAGAIIDCGDAMCKMASGPSFTGPS